MSVSQRITQNDLEKITAQRAIRRQISSILRVNLAGILEHVDTPEWAWITEVATFNSAGNIEGQGRFEHIVDINGLAESSFPEAIRVFWHDAKEHDCNWILFHQD